MPSGITKGSQGGQKPERQEGSFLYPPVTVLFLQTLKHALKFPPNLTHPIAQW